MLFVSPEFAWHVVSDIPEDEARYWAKKLEQLNAMRDQDVSCNLFRFSSAGKVQLE